jgi:hypothetical protein
MDNKPIRVAIFIDPKTGLWSAVADQQDVLLCVIDDTGPSVFWFA